MLYTWEQQCHLMSRVPYGIANRYIYICIFNCESGRVQFVVLLELRHETNLLDLNKRNY
jgi:hypothetical protein